MGPWLRSTRTSRSACRRSRRGTALRDFGAVHQRVAPGFVTATRLDGDDRVVTFFTGAEARERLVSVDDARRRLVYTVVESQLGSAAPPGVGRGARRATAARVPAGVDGRRAAGRDRAGRRRPDGAGRGGDRPRHGRLRRSSCAMDVLLTIGEFSKMTYLSVKALRHYHDVGLLAPALVDPDTGYRRYAAEPGRRPPRRSAGSATSTCRSTRSARCSQAPDLAARNRVDPRPPRAHARSSSSRPRRRSRRCRRCSPATRRRRRRVEIRRIPATRVAVATGDRRLRRLRRRGSSRRSPTCTRRSSAAGLDVGRRRRRAVPRRVLRGRRRRGDGVRPGRRRRRGTSTPSTSRPPRSPCSSTTARSPTSTRPTARSARSSPSAASAAPARSASTTSPRPAPRCAGPSPQEHP